MKGAGGRFSPKMYKLSGGRSNNTVPGLNKCHIYIDLISLTVKIKEWWVNSKMCKLAGGRSNNTVPGGRSNNTDRGGRSNNTVPGLNIHM